MAVYNSVHSGANIDAAVSNYLTIEGNGGTASKNWTTT